MKAEILEIFKQVAAEQKHGLAAIIRSDWQPGHYAHDSAISTRNAPGIVMNCAPC